MGMDLLTFCQEDIMYTRLLERVNTSAKKLDKMLEEFSQLNLINCYLQPPINSSRKRPHRHYKTTSDGCRLLNQYNLILNRLTRKSLEIPSMETDVLLLASKSLVQGEVKE